MPFVKLDCNILDSSLWTLRPERDLFLTALCMATPLDLEEPTPTYNEMGEELDFVVPPGKNYGFVEASATGIVRRAGLDNDYEFEDAIKAVFELGDPDFESKNPAHGGRRMVRIEGGFIILNFGTHRKKDHTNAERQKRFRERQKKTIKKALTSGKSNGERNAVTPLRNVTKRNVTLPVTEAEAEAEAYFPESSSTREADVTTPEQGETIDYEAIRRLYWKQTHVTPTLQAIVDAVALDGEKAVIDGTTAIALKVFQWPKGWQQKYTPSPPDFFRERRYLEPSTDPHWDRDLPDRKGKRTDWADPDANKPLPT